MEYIEYDLESSLVEIREILALTKKASIKKNTSIVSSLNKAALVLLASKFESFLENTVESYVFILNSNKVQKDKLPLSLRTNHLKEELLPLMNDKSISDKNLESMCKNIAKFFHDENHTIKISNKFNYGKHGSKEVKKLFKRIGFEDVFDCFSCITITNLVRIDVTAEIDSITFIRNNIIHADADPALSDQQISNYITNVDIWCKCLIDYLNSELTHLCEHA